MRQLHTFIVNLHHFMVDNPAIARAFGGYRSPLCPEPKIGTPGAVSAVSDAIGEVTQLRRRLQTLNLVRAPKPPVPRKRKAT